MPSTIGLMGTPLTLGRDPETHKHQGDAYREDWVIAVLQVVHILSKVRSRTNVSEPKVLTS